MNPRQRSLLVIVVGGVFLFPLFGSLCFEAWPLEGLLELQPPFYVGIFAAQAGLLAAWVAFAHVTLLERVYCAPLSLLVMAFSWGVGTGMGVPGYLMAYAAIVAVVVSVAQLLLGLRRFSWALPSFFVISVVGCWFVIDRTLIADNSEALEVLAGATCSLAYFGAILTLPMFLLKRFSRWRIVTSVEQGEVEAEPAKTFSLAQLMGWMTLAALVAGLFARAAAKSNGSLGRVNVSEFVETMIPLSVVALYFAIAVPILLRASLASPRWKTFHRLIAVLGLILFGAIPAALFGLGSRFGLIALLPIPTFILFYTGTLMVLRQIGFHMPRAQSTHLEERSE